MPRRSASNHQDVMQRGHAVVPPTAVQDCHRLRYMGFDSQIEQFAVHRLTTSPVFEMGNAHPATPPLEECTLRGAHEKAHQRCAFR